MIVTPKSENRRLLQEALETMRDLHLFGVARPGKVDKVKRLLRTAGVPVPRPRRDQ